MNFANVTNIIIPQGEVIQIQDSLSRILWKKSSPTVLPYFYVEDMSGSENILSINKISDNAPTLTIEMSRDGVNWSTLGTTSTTAISTSIPTYGRVYLRCNTSGWSTNYGNAINRIYCSQSCRVGGNIMSLLYGSNFVGNEVIFPSGSNGNFFRLFSNSNSINDASTLILPATTLTNYCYGHMFDGCTSLTTAPALPATTLVDSCYSFMFYGCTSLTTAPALPATTLAYGCYGSMFKGCTSLTTAPTLPATTLANYCYSYMFDGCTSLTTTQAILPATTLTIYCYRNMFYGCSALTTAPELPATILVDYCYKEMFYGCTNLNNIKCIATDISAYECLLNWLVSTSNNGTFTKKAGITWPSSWSGIPSGWTVIEV